MYYVKIPCYMLSKGAIAEIAKRIGEKIEKETPNNFYCENIFLENFKKELDKCCKEEDQDKIKEVAENYIKVMESKEYKEEEERVKRINDFNFEQYFWESLEWLTNNGYLVND